MANISEEMAEKGLALLKEGKGPTTIKRFGQTAALGLGVGAGLAGVEAAAKALGQVVTYKRDYEKMMDFAPELKNYDQEQVKARFNTLRRFNPTMSTDPLVSSSWVKQTMEYPVTPAALKDVARPAEKVSPALTRLIPEPSGVFED